MEQFSLEKWLENPSRKIVTRQGKSVRIICTDRRHTDSWPIVALEDYGDGEFVICANIDGRTDMCSENIHDLFFADEEKRLSEFETVLKEVIEDVQNGYYIEEESFDFWKDRLIDLARKELQPEFDKEMDKMLAETDKVVYQKGREDALKDLPKWKKATEHKEFAVHVCVMDEDMFPYLDTEVNEGEYYIELSDLKNLPEEK